MVFEPISGSIGAIALIDPALRGASWIYGKYKLQKQFGDHYQAFTVMYSAEVARFVMIRDQKIHLLEKSPLNEAETFLNEAIRGRLVLAVKALEECEKLMEEYHHRGKEQEDNEQSDRQGDESSFDNQAVGPITSTSTTETDPSIALTRGTNLSSSGTAVSHSSSPTTTSSKSISAKQGRRYQFLRPKFLTGTRGRKQKKETEEVAKILPQPPGQTARQAASYGLGEHRKDYEDTQLQRQKQSTMVGRLLWITGDRERFVCLLDEIVSHNDYFASVILLQKPSQHVDGHPIVETTALSIRTASVASHLRRLIRSLEATRASNRIVFLMKLLDDPFDLRSHIGVDLPASALLRPSSSMFAFQIRRSPLNSLSSIMTPDSIVSLILEVPAIPSLTTEDVAQQIATQRPRIESFTTEMSTSNSSEGRGEDEDDKLWWAATGTIEDIASQTRQNRSVEPISVFHDRTSYIPFKTLLDSFRDERESNIRLNNYLSYRIRLAYILASSFLHFRCAGYPIEYFSKSLYYFLESGVQPAPVGRPSLAQGVVTPYIQLRAIGAGQPSKSSSPLFAAAAKSTSIDQIMVQSLGVLLCEIGRWIPVDSSEDWQSKIAAARIDKIGLMKCATAEYFRVVNACLEFTPLETENAAIYGVWLETNVVQPLQQILGNLPSEFQRV